MKKLQQEQQKQEQERLQREKARRESHSQVRNEDDSTGDRKHA